MTCLSQPNRNACSPKVLPCLQIMYAPLASSLLKPLSHPTIGKSARAAAKIDCHLIQGTVCFIGLAWSHRLRLQVTPSCNLVGNHFRSFHQGIKTSTNLLHLLKVLINQRLECLVPFIPQSSQNFDPGFK